MANTSAYKVGQVVELIDGRHATVRFVGTTAFAEGDWIGVELSESSGKNDGSVKGQRYFDCDPEHGLFMRSTSIKTILQSPTPKPKAAPATTTTKKTVPGSRQSTINGQKTTASDSATKRRQTLNASSPSPAPRASLAAAGRKSPSKLATRAPATSTSTTTSRTATTATTAARRPTTTTTTASRTSASRPSAVSSTPTRTSTGTTAATRTARPSVGGTAASAKKPSTATTAASRPSSMAAARSSRVSSVGSKPNGIAQHSRNTSMASSVKSQPKSDDATPAEAQEERDDNDDKGDDEETLKEDGSVAEDQEQDAKDQSEEDDDRQEESKDDIEPEGPPKTNGTAVVPKKPQPPPATTRAPARTPAKAAPVPPSNRHVMELEAKLKAGEKQVEEYKQQLKVLEKIQADRDRFEGIIQRLQAKYQPQQQELVDLRKRLKEMEEKVEENQAVLESHDEDMEMATLDREMAEENAESLRAELKEIQIKLEELQLENEVLKDENAEYTREMSPEERSSQGWLQKERENDRLREALIRLRDMTQDREAELNNRINELEDESKQLSGVSEEYELLKENLKRSESAVEDLKAQLETATGAEDMIEDLTNQNLTLSDQIKDLNGTIDYLEALKELNDDLEASHIDAERQMQDEIDYKDAVLIEQVRFNVQQREKMTDYEYTINKFRDVVSNLQEHISEMQKSQEISDKDAEALTARSKAMTDLNMKLQTSVAKTQSNTLDLELRRMEAQEAVEHLAITQMFLPEGFDSERRAVSSYLRFKRISAKARLLHQTLRDKILGNVPVHAHENPFAMCDVADKLVWIAAMCDRFVNDISSCAASRFMSYAAAFNELEPVERSINGYIEIQKRGDLKLNEVSEELQRLTALLAHLAEVHIPEDSVEASADIVIMRSVLIQSYLENTAAALVLARNQIPNADHEDDAEHIDGLSEFQNKAENMAGQLRSIRVVVGKAIHSLEELRARSMALRHDLAEPFEQFQHSSSRLAASARQLGEHIRNALEDGSGEDDSARDAIRAALSTFCLTILGDNTTSDPLASLSPKISIASTQANGLLSLTGDLSKTVEFERLQAPWVMRADQVKNSKMSSLRAEDEVRRLKEEIAGHLSQLQARNQTLEEQHVKIELLESRTKDVNSKTNRITELQRLVETSKVREKELIGAMEKQIQDNQTLLIERDRWKQTAAEQKPTTGVKETVRTTEHAAVSSIEMDALKLEIEGLKGAVRYIHTDKDSSFNSSLSLAYNPWLEQPLTDKPTARQIDQASLRKRGSDVLTDLLDMAANARWIDLSTLPEDKLAWRPAKQQPRWQILREREKWQAWKSRRDAVLEGTVV